VRLWENHSLYKGRETKSRAQSCLRLEDWGRLLRDNGACSAILDRLLHRGHLLKFEGKSYRLKEASARLSENRRRTLDEKGKNVDLPVED